MGFRFPRPFRRPRVGLVLSGGGARGIAHIGVLKVLEREGIPVDLLAGTSAGGLAAALYAAGLSAAEIEKEALRITRLRNLVSLLDPTVRRPGIFEGNRIENYLRGLLDEVTFTALKIPLSLVAVNLEIGEEVILRQGDVVDALRATTAYPGVFAPCETDGCPLVDGGLLNNLPTDVVRKMGAELVIAVDVTADMDDLAPFWNQVRGSRLLPRISLIVETLIRCMGIMVNHLRRQRLEKAPVDVLIEPEIPPDITTFSGFTRAVECIAAGESAAEEAVPLIKDLLRRRVWFR